MCPSNQTITHCSRRIILLTLNVPTIFNDYALQQAHYIDLGHPQAWIKGDVQGPEEQREKVYQEEQQHSRL